MKHCHLVEVDGVADAKAERAASLQEPPRFLSDTWTGTEWLDMYVRGKIIVMVPSLREGMHPDLLEVLKSRRKASLDGECPACGAIETIGKVGSLTHDAGCPVSDDAIAELIRRVGLPSSPESSRRLADESIDGPTTDGPVLDQMEAAVQETRHRVNRSLGQDPGKRPQQGQSPFFEEIWERVDDQRCRHLGDVAIQPWTLVLPSDEWKCDKCVTKLARGLEVEHLDPVEEHTCDRCRSLSPPDESGASTLQPFVLRQDLFTVVGSLCPPCFHAIQDSPGSTLVDP